MLRRRRRAREIPFSFDSFLDVVANVVGIIIRLILVVWVGARSYSSLTHTPKIDKKPPEKGPLTLTPADPLQEELARARQALALAQSQLLERLRQLQGVQGQHQQAGRELAGLAAGRQGLDGERAALSGRAADQGRAAREVALSLDELRQRGRRLAEEIASVRKLPSPKKALRYRTPVSQPVQSEEVLFECRGGRVSFIDIAALLAEVRRGIEHRGKLPRPQWQVMGVAGPVGAFRLHYTVERRRGLLEAIGPTDSGSPDPNVDFSYGLSEWQVEPIAPQRGETADRALAEGSEFRQVVDGLDPVHAVVTFWVYPDSFALYRQLRDFLYERDLIVAGRPLPEGVP